MTKEGKQLKAKERVVADGIASETQCNTLRNMVMVSPLHCKIIRVRSLKFRSSVQISE